MYKSPENWPELFKDCDMIYISHNHEDHLHADTLKQIFKVNPDVRVVIPPFESCRVLLEGMECKNLEVIEFDTWFRMGDANGMIFKGTAIGPSS